MSLSEDSLLPLHTLIGGCSQFHVNVPVKVNYFYVKSNNKNFTFFQIKIEKRLIYCTNMTVQIIEILYKMSPDVGLHLSLIHI